MKFTFILKILIKSFLKTLENNFLTQRISYFAPHWPLQNQAKFTIPLYLHTSLHFSLDHNPYLITQSMMYVLILLKWRDLQFNINSEWQTFKKLFDYLSSALTILGQASPRKIYCLPPWNLSATQPLSPQLMQILDMQIVRGWLIAQAIFLKAYTYVSKLPVLLTNVVWQKFFGSDLESR